MADFLAKNVIRIVSGVIIIGAVTVLTNSMVPVASKHKDAACAIGASTVAVNQAYALSATGLPTTDPVYLIVTPPSGVGSVSQVLVSSTGTWSGTESSGLTGTWTYTFSGLQTNNKYGAVAICSVHVN
jgi:hypothetical protein